MYLTHSVCACALCVRVTATILDRVSLTLESQYWVCTVTLDSGQAGQVTFRASIFPRDGNNDLFVSLLCLRCKHAVSACSVCLCVYACVCMSVCVSPCICMCVCVYLHICVVHVLNPGCQACETHALPLSDSQAHGPYTVLNTHLSRAWNKMGKICILVISFPLEEPVDSDLICSVSKE